MSTGLMLFMKPRIQHALPGRLRISMPVMKKIGAKGKRWIPILSRLLAMPQGIDSVTPNDVSGTVVVSYDSSLVTQTEIMNYFNWFTKLCLNNRQRLEQLRESELLRLEKPFCSWLEKVVSNISNLDSDLRIPEHVFN